MCLGLATGYTKTETDKELAYIEGQLIEAVLENILAKRRLHRAQYHREPEFVKMPYFVAKEIARYYNKYVPVNDTICDTLYGMKVCPSHSLTEYKEIEVF